MLADIRYAIRGFYRSPGFAFAAVLSLALGIGANTAIFSLVNAILLRTLPVREADRLVIFTLKTSTPARFGGSNISQAIYGQIRDKNTALEAFAAITGSYVALSDGEGSERVDGSAVSVNFFQTLGLNATIGRVPTPEDGDQVCVISYPLWLRRFQGDTSVIGRKILIDGKPLTVMGVTPQKFLSIYQGYQTDVSYPLALAGPRAGVQTFGRLKPGVSLTQAQAGLDALYHQIQTRPADAAKLADTRVVLQQGSHGFSQLRSQYGTPLVMLMAIVGLVLLIACANIANLLMARTSRRAKEIAVRLALGAGRGRLVRQIVVETMVLTTFGAALGMVLAYWTDRALAVLAPPQPGGSALIVDVSPEWRVFLFTLGVAIAVSLLSASGPAIRSTRPDLAPALKGEVGVRAPGRLSPTNALVVTQVAVSLVLLIGAGLFLRSLHNLRLIDPGFNPEHLIVLTIDAQRSGYPPAKRQRLFDEIVERARALPGMVSISPGVISPLSGDFMMGGIRVAGYVPQPNESNEIAFTFVGPDYIKTLGTPLVAGRVFTDQDDAANKFAIVNEKTAAHYWPSENPIGKHVKIGIGGVDGDCEIVGVVKNEKTDSLREAPLGIVYLPFRLSFLPFMALHVRTAGSAAPAISALMREVRSLDRNVLVRDATTMAAQIDRSIALDRLMASLTALFGLLAVVLAAVGLYGVMAFTVAARTREIGIRMALGADRARVLGQVLRESAVLTMMGITLGLLGALWASRAVGSFLYGLSATDPWTYAVLAIVLGGIALSAAWIPARRAADVDPMVALRYE
jgi:putative ABC transport system permease protein